MDQNRIKRNQMLGAKIVKELTARNMEAYYTDSKEEALKKALELIPEGSSISWGGSMSVNEIGLKEAVCQGNYQVYNRDTAPTPEDKRKIELAAYDCDYFLTSANAITEDGIMINIDGHSNRVSSIAAGPIICISWKSTLIMTVVSSIPQMHFIVIRIRCRIN